MCLTNQGSRAKNHIAEHDKKKIRLAPALQERGLKLCRLFEKNVLGDKQMWAIIQNTNHFHLKVHRGQRVAALDQRSAPGRR